MVDYKKFKLERMDAMSPSFCASKWLASDFWIENGTTSSCHLPPPHKIDLSLLDKNINLLNNTNEKIMQRSQMLRNEQPAGCSNCWQVENIDPNAISERITSSHDNFKDNDFTSLDLSSEQIPKIITVSFDSLCNFTCSYCDATQSSSWATDLKVNGPYKKIQGDSRNTYQRLGKKEKLSADHFEYLLNKFIQYITTNISKIQIINCLGGEPLISKNFWNFLNTIILNDCSQITLIVTTNLSDEHNIKKILKFQHYFKNIKIHASLENVGNKAEFVRSGLNWKKFENNFNLLLENNIDVTLLGTVSLLALDGLVEFLNWYSKYEDHVSLHIYRLRHPVFQAIQILPNNLKLYYIQQLDKWIKLHPKGNKQSPNLIEQVKNIVTILNNECNIYNNIDVNILQSSAKEFYKEYANRHSHNIKDIFSYEMSNWILN